MKGLLVDFGGVLTTNVFESFRAFCVDEGLDPDAVKRLFRGNPEALRLVRRIETGVLSDDEFGERFGELLGIERRAGLLERMFGHVRPEQAMVEAVRRARAQRVRTGLISNSMGVRHYDRSAFPELFDGVVISGDEGIHKPQPEIFRLGAERVGLPPEASGLRSSWARVARNSSFRRSASRSASSCSIRPVTSTVIPSNRIGVPDTS